MREQAKCPTLCVRCVIKRVMGDGVTLKKGFCYGNFDDSVEG